MGVFFNIKDDGAACLKQVDDFLLNAKNKQNTLDMCWDFVYRQVAAKDDVRKIVAENKKKTKRNENQMEHQENVKEKCILPSSFYIYDSERRSNTWGLCRSDGWPSC